MAIITLGNDQSPCLELDIVTYFAHAENVTHNFYVLNFQTGRTTCKYSGEKYPRSVTFSTGAAGIQIDPAEKVIPF